MKKASILLLPNYLKPQFLLGLLLLSVVCYPSSENNSSIEQLYQLNHSLLKSNLDSAKIINTQLIKIGIGKIDSSLFAKILTIRGNIAFHEGNYNQSMESNLEALKIRSSLKDSVGIAFSLNNIGNVYYYTNAFEKAINYHQKSFHIRHLLNLDLDDLIGNLNTIALVFEATEEYDSALFYYKKAFSLLNDTVNIPPLDIARLYDNMGSLYERLDQPDLALENLDSSIQVLRRGNRLRKADWNYTKRGAIYLEQRDYSNAILSLRLADSLSKFNSTLELKKDISHFLFKYFMLTNQADSAEKYLSKKAILEDSVISQKTNENIQAMEARYQVSQKEAALALSKERTARLSAENKTNKLYLTIAIAGLLLLGSTLIMVSRVYRQKRKFALLELELIDKELKETMANQESSALSSMLKGQEEERERIAKDLHDQLGGTLAALKLGLRRSGNVVDRSDLDIVDQAVSEVRSIAHNLSTGLVEKHGLGIALKELKQNIERSGKIKFDLFLQTGFANINQKIAIELYRVIQELTNNTIKHAHATHIELQTNTEGKNFNIIYEDNGVGFNKIQLNRGMGLRNIEARIKNLNGSLHIDSKEGRGTIVIIEIESLKT